jgi:FAD-dependent monooxygenase
MVDARYGWKVVGVEEQEGKVRTTATWLETGEQKTFVSEYAAGCDGASSAVQKSPRIPLDGGPT